MRGWMHGWTDVVARTGPSCTVTCNHPHYLRCPPVSPVVPVALGAEAGVAVHLVQAAGIVLAPVVLAVIEVLAAVAPHIARHTLAPGAGRGGSQPPLPFPPAPPGIPLPMPPGQPTSCSSPKSKSPPPSSREKAVWEVGAHLGPWLVEMQVEPCWHGLSSAEQKSSGCSQKSPAGQKRGCQGVHSSSGTGGAAPDPAGSAPSREPSSLQLALPWVQDSALPEAALAPARSRRHPRAYPAGRTKT